MATPDIVVTDVIDDDIQRAVGGGLNAFNDAVTGISDRRALAVVVKDPTTGDVVGGAIGRSAVLYTISFQAPGFYERNGWRRFGEIPSDPPGTSRIFMTKEL